VLIDAADCYITLKAHQNKKTEKGFLFVRLSHLKDDKASGGNRAFDIFFYTTFTVIIALFIVLGCIWKGRIALPITQKQLENMDLDLIKTITNRSMLEAIADLTRDEMMEVERENIRVLEALGEGAFGLVKKAIIIKDGEKHQVAVKMLKSTEKKSPFNPPQMTQQNFIFR
jgi:SpoVK/Ycf46/Vps4 family AAA+-type ATPase